MRHLQDDYLDADMTASVMAEIPEEPQGWPDRHGRTIAQFGWAFVIGHDTLHPAPPIPPVMAQIAEDVGASMVAVKRLRHGDQIGPHIDSPLFGDRIAILTLGPSGAPISFRPPKSARETLYLAPGSLLTFDGEDRWVHAHELGSPPGVERWSLTLRNPADMTPESPSTPLSCPCCGGPMSAAERDMWRVCRACVVRASGPDGFTYAKGADPSA